VKEGKATSLRKRKKKEKASAMRENEEEKSPSLVFILTEGSLIEDERAGLRGNSGPPHLVFLLDGRWGDKIHREGEPYFHLEGGKRIETDDKNLARPFFERLPLRVAPERRRERKLGA